MSDHDGSGILACQTFDEQERVIACARIGSALMAFPGGTRLGPYEVTAPLGSGGMGDVYRARDSKLGRDVALKVLPDSFVHDRDRLGRFRREAQVLASLNNPPIGATTSPTLSIHATQTGMLLGTAAYMAPEQARGKAVDARADIWAFGVVVFEMLAGQRPFEGDEISDTLASILKSEPAWPRLPADTPPAIHRLLKRSLQKDRHQRLQHIGDARLEIEEALQPPAPPFIDHPASLSRRARLAVPVVLAAAIAVGAGVGWKAAQPPRASELR